jgi:two-component system nitrogen regulation response regulator NtrX
MPGRPLKEILFSGKLKENDWNISKTAEAIGLERTALYRKLKQLGIEF